jgi:Lon protease-like protein
MTPDPDSAAISSEQLAELDFRTQINAVSSVLGIAPADKQRLLELDHLGERAHTLISILEQISSRQQLIDRFQHLRPDEPGSN